MSMNDMSPSKVKHCVNCVAGFPVRYCVQGIPDGCYSQEESTGEDAAFFLGDSSEINAQSEKDERVYADPVSTGRKRAAKLYPIAVGQICEWAWKKHCGGGISPITGCTGRPAVHIHHGPDKSTLNNERENISLICNFCHNRWHAGNDQYYTEPRPENGTTWLPNVPEGKEIFPLSAIQKAAKEEVLMAELLIPEGGKDRS